MSILGARLRARAFSLVATAATVVASLTSPAVPPAEAQGLPDLAIPAGLTTANVRVNEPFAIIHYVQNVGTGNARAGTLWRMSLPAGFQITSVSYTRSGGLWKCSFNPVVASCFNDYVIVPQDTTRFRVDIKAPSTPRSQQVASSKIDVNQTVAESNEANNELRTVVNVLP